MTEIADVAVDIADLALRRARSFVREHVLPVDDEFDGDIAAAGGDEFRPQPAGCCTAGCPAIAPRPG